MRGRGRERERLESGEGAPLERGRGREGRGTGRTGAYGVDPSGATANVSVSVSAGRASGPADIIQEVTSRTCPIIPLPPNVVLVAVLLRRAVATRSVRPYEVQVFHVCISRPHRRFSCTEQSGIFRPAPVSTGRRWIASGWKKEKKKKGGGCKVELAGFVIPRIFAKWGRNGRLVEIMGHEATSERDEPLTAARSSDHRNRNEIDAFISRETCPYLPRHSGFRCTNYSSGSTKLWQISGASIIRRWDRFLTRVSNFTT